MGRFFLRMSGGVALAAAASLGVWSPGCGSEEERPLTCDPPAAPTSPIVFVDRAAELEVDFAHEMQSDLCHITDTIGGPGTCLFDFDGDRDLDIFFPNRTLPSALYRNDGGAFVDVAADVGVALPGDALGCLAFDYDGDGDLDLYVSAIGPDVLYENRGGTFADVSAERGIVEDGFSTSATAGDIDGDGDLDLFVGRVVKLETCPDACYLFPINCMAERSLLFVNHGGTFVEEGTARGLGAEEPTLANLFFDFDRDGDLDLYVGNDMGVAFDDRLYLNDGTGHFVDRGKEKGFALPGSDTMGVDVGDVDQDSFTDLVTSDFEGRPTRLVRCFDDVLSCSVESLPAESTQGVRWSIGLEDFDLDGDLDLFQSAGHVFDPEREGALNQLFWNEGGEFEAHTPDPLDALGGLAIHRGASFGDLDGDGDVDVVVGVNGGRPKLLYNQAARGHFVRVELDTRAAGATVAIRYPGGGTTEHAVVGGGYLGSSDAALTFGIGDACEAEVEVTWLGGERRVETARAGTTIRVARP